MIVIKHRELLWDMGISGKELHLATGISQTKISEIIRGKRTNVTLETVEKFACFWGAKSKIWLISEKFNFCKKNSRSSKFHNAEKLYILVCQCNGTVCIF